MNEDSDIPVDDPTGSVEIKRAAEILTRNNPNYREITKSQKRNIIIAFARRDQPVYGEAFDVVKIEGKIDLDSEIDVERNFKNITLVEIKSTRGKKQNGKVLNEEFDGYFFGLTTAELLVAQKLQNKYEFVFVNMHTEKFKIMTLKEILAQAKAIYPQWSIRF